jgi:hypothetical protein
VTRNLGAEPTTVSGLAARSRRTDWKAVFDAAMPVTLGVTFIGLNVMSRTERFVNACVSVSKAISIVDPSTVATVIVFAVPVMICFFFVDRPLRFGLCVAAILGISLFRERDTELVHSERSFFGILKVEREVHWQNPPIRDEEGRRVGSGKIEFLKLVHGTTLHGTQMKKLDNNVLDYFQVLPAVPTPLDAVTVYGTIAHFNAREEPLTYYHRTGPVGAMFRELRSRKGGADARADVAMVGLGTGSVSCYALDGQNLTFYEIDPAVRNLVEPPTYFTYVDDATKRGARVDFRMGDARLKIKEEVNARYALLLVDAFSSDSIPVHLLTREAVELYFDRMTEDGILALHISNKFVRLEPVVAEIAHDLNVTARVWNDDGERGPGKTASSWVVLARKPEHLGDLAAPQPRQVAKFIDDKLPLLDLYNRYGGEAKLLDVIKTEHGQRAEVTLSLVRNYGTMRPLKQLLKWEATSSVQLIEKLRTKYGATSMLQTAIQQENSPEVSELKVLLKGKEAVTLQQVWEDVGGPRVELLREWVAKYAATDPEPAEGKENEMLNGTRLQGAILFEFGPKFADLAPVAANSAAERKIEDALLIRYGPMFRPVERLPDVPTWTDDYSDVLRVMMIPELQKVRKFLGLKTPVER